MNGRLRIPAMSRRLTAPTGRAVPAGPVAREEDLLRDHEPLDLRRALVDLEQLRVAHQLLDRVLLDVAVAAEDLDGVRWYLHSGVGGEPLREGRVKRRVPTEALVEHPGGLPAQETRGL